MKKLLKTLFVLVLAFSVIFAAVACKDEKKEKTDTERLYELAQSAGFTGTYEEWLNALIGIPGDKGDKGDQGAKGEVGVNGLSAYDLYCKYHPVYKGTEEEWTTALADGRLMASYKTEYNIIFTLATVPPVLASLDALANGADTYACIERGKTYNGINNLENFHNVAFDTSSNQSAGFTNVQMDALVDKIKELNVFGNENFNIYVSDANGISAFGIAANAQLTSSQYDITLLEDGSGAYDSFANYYLKDKTVSATVDQPYDTFVARVEQTKQEVESILARTDNKYSEYGYDLAKAITLATFPNVSFWYQDIDNIESMLKQTDNGSSHSKLLSVFGVEGYSDEVAYRVSVKGSNIAESVDKLDEEKRADYLKLMYGSAYEGTYNGLTRTTNADGDPVPADKLVFIGTRIKDYPKYATDAAYGVGGLGDGETVPATYAALEDKYKNDLLFGTEGDYNTLLSVFNAFDYGSIDATAKETVKREMFNIYLDYIFSFKLTYALYGDDYDIILKGHPREVIGESESWTQHYDAADCRYDELVNAAALAFHEKDSVGKFIGTVPFGTSAENLAYLGVEIAICGLPSSTYTGYETSVPVKFILNNIDGNITADGTLIGRYEKGNLKDGDKVTAFINNGYFFKLLSSYYTEEGNATAAATYAGLLEDWLRRVNDLDGSADLTGYDVDAQGFVIIPIN